MVYDKVAVNEAGDKVAKMILALIDAGPGAEDIPAVTEAVVALASAADDLRDNFAAGKFHLVAGISNGLGDAELEAVPA